MAAGDIAAAWQRRAAVLRRRPDTGLSDDAPATARWDGGTRVVTAHANGTRLETDMPKEMGGSGDRVSPGWLLRASLASCLATRISLAAAAEGIELGALEVRVGSRSDTRGLLGMADANGEAVSAGPRDMQLRVLIAAPGVSDQRLQALVEDSHRCSPTACAVRDAVPVALHIEIGA